MKKRIDEQREMDKKMFQILKKNKGLIREFKEAPELDVEEPTDAPQNDAPQEEGGITPSKVDVIKQQEQFRQTIAPDTIFTSFTILPEQSNVIFSGTIPGICDFVFDMNQREGFGFSTPNQITMTSEVFDVIEMMNGYFKNWRSEMSDKLREYQQGEGNA